MIVHVCLICVAWSSEKLNMVAIGVEIVDILIWGWLSSWLDMEMLWDVLIVDFFYKKKSTWPACTWPLSSPLLASNSYVHSLLQGHHLVANTKAHLDLLISLINLATLIFICPHDNDLHTKFLWRETKKLVIIFIILLCFRAFLNVFNSKHLYSHGHDMRPERSIVHYSWMHPNYEDGDVFKWAIVDPSY